MKSVNQSELSIQVRRIKLTFEILCAARVIIIWKWQERKKEELPKHPSLLTRKLEEEEFKPSPSTSTRCSSKCTPKSVSPRRPWTSWTPSFTILSTELPLKVPSSSDSTREELSHPERSNLLWSSSSPVNSPGMPSLRAPRLSQNTSNNDFCVLIYLAHFYTLSRTLKRISCF